MSKHDILSVVVHKHDVALTNTMRRFAHELIETAIKDERAKIVAFLAEDSRGLEGPFWANAIEAGEHLR